MILNWVAYCEECNKQLDVAPNGPWIEAKARVHAESTGHKCLVGYEVTKTDQDQKKDGKA